MAVLFLLLLSPFAGPQDSDFAEILRRFESDDPAVREEASKSLEGYLQKLGPQAIDFLTAKVAGTQGEVKARLEEQLSGLLRIEKCRKMLSFLSVFDIPSTKGKRLVILNTGNTGWSQTPDNIYFHYELGWVIAESPEEITLLGMGLEPVPWERNRTTQKDWERVREKQPKDYPPPGEIREVELQKMCRDLIEATKTDATEGVGFFHRARNAWTLTPVLFAHWCLERDLGTLALELVELGESAWRAQTRDGNTPFRDILIERACEHLRYQAVSGGTPARTRPEVLKKWRNIETLSPHFRKGEAREMIGLYEEMIREDEAWKEPPPQELAARDPQTRANHWIYHLRDVAARQSSDPGSCEILGPFGKPKAGGPFPPDELVKLGWDALPAVIEHLDDRRPTRSVGWHRGFSPSSYYQLRVGDCCEQIFTAITGYSIYRARTTSSAMVKDGDAPASKEKALQWWAERKGGGAESYYVDALGKPELATTAATKLLAMDRSKHLPRLLGILEKGPRESRNAILSPLGPHLGKEQEKWIEAVLADPDAEPVISAARILWDHWRSDKGGLEVIARLATVEAVDGDARILWSGPYVLRPMRTEKIARGLIDLMGAKNTRVRMEAFRTAATFPNPGLAARLTYFLDDKEPTGWSGSYPIRFCDEAAEALIRMAGLGEKYALKGTDEERDRTIGDLKKWWEKDGPSFDWKTLLWKIEEEERPRTSEK